MSRDCCVALPRGAMALSAVVEKFKPIRFNPKHCDFFTVNIQSPKFHVYAIKDKIAIQLNSDAL